MATQDKKQASYYVSGKDHLVLHHATCGQVTRMAKLLRRVRPWPWAEGRTDKEIVIQIRALHFRPCRACHPFLKGPIERLKIK